MQFLDRVAAALAGAAAAALLMAEFQFSSTWGNWQPSHLSAIAVGILSIAVSQISGSAKNEQAQKRG